MKYQVTDVIDKQKGVSIMKNIIFASIFALGFSAYAQEGADMPAPEQKVEKKEKVVKHGKHKKVEKTEKKVEGAE